MIRFIKTNPDGVILILTTATIMVSVVAFFLNVLTVVTILGGGK